jgi:hypothetical protein
MGITGSFEGSASSTLWLYDGRNRTNGWISAQHVSSASSYYKVHNDETSAGPVSQGSVSWVLSRYSNSIILTPYKTLHLVLSTYTDGTAGTMRVGVGSPNMSGNNFTVAVDLAQNTSKPGGINWINDTTYSLNVSNLSGTYQVFAYLYLKAPTKSRTISLVILKAWLTN